MNFDKIASVAETYQRAAKAPLGFVFRDLSSGKTVSYHGDEPFPTASTFKLFVLAELYRKAAAGECRLTDRISLSDGQKCLGSGVLALVDAGAALTLKDYATLMMVLSDNTATDVIYEFVGRDAIRKNVIDALGLTHTRCDFSCAELIDTYYEMRGRSLEQMLADCGGVPPSYRGSRWYRCLPERNNQTSPLEAAKMLELLYRGQWVGRETSNAMLSILRQCQTNRRIPYHLPEYQSVAHKTGTMDRLCADIGIVYAGDAGAYILCLYYNGNLAGEADYARDARNRVGDNLLAALSRDIFRAYLESPQ